MFEPFEILGGQTIASGITGLQKLVDGQATSGINTKSFEIVIDIPRRQPCRRNIQIVGDQSHNGSPQSIAACPRFTGRIQERDLTQCDARLSPGTAPANSARSVRSISAVVASGRR